ncbi:hypothetical protein EW026_g7633 [Hermanssonia centrifuga]|uniref:DUF6532 domain-containing protein n=1 Tax=Hermanssonia centrifuga TaxID=98765 RepID=A0A4S4K771_9APHY|nr:hypothetical protein EW026_g7633 [Hermanssonia centrifuga]
MASDDDIQELAVNSSKRPRSPSTDDEKLPPTPKAVKIIDHSGRARQQDYDAVVKHIIKTAIDLYEVKLLTVSAFPLQSMEADWVTEVWTEACQHEGVKYRITPDLYKMLTRRGTHLRSELKIKARKTVAMYYKLKPGQSTSAKEKNKRLIVKLLQETGPDRNLFIYPVKEQAREPATRQHIYRHPAIGNIINEYVFGDRNLLGVLYTEYFGDQLPKPTIALAATFIEFCLKEWAEGHFDDATFTVSKNSTIFASHLADLDKFQRLTMQFDLYRDITDSAHTAGRMPDKVFEDMLKAYEERETTESESEVPDKSSDIE